MTSNRYLLPLCLALTCGAAPLFAQDAEPGTSQPAAATADAPKDAPAPQPPAGKKDTGAKTKQPSDSGGNSPFDYRASEEISEDLPVAFPADI
jgi:hypothetical protein